MAAPGPIITYRANIDNIAPNNLVGANLRMALVSSAYTPDATNTGNATWANVSANEIANGNGYATGGVALTGVVAAVTNGFKLSSGNPSWTASGGSIPAWRYAVLYWLGTIDGVVNPLVGYCLGDSTPADVPATTVGNTLAINCPAGGWYDVTEA
jgi:hypothetical protein